MTKTQPSARIVVLAKPPARGRAKSRLAADVGEAAAARLARAMLADTWTATASFAASPGAERSPEEESRSCCDDHEPSPYHVALATTDPSEAYPLLCPEPTVVDQGEGNLGARMATLLRDNLADTDAVLLLGSDSPGLPPGHLSDALHALAHADIVLGPCENGGFWCVGLNASAPAASASVAQGSWLDDIDWSRQDTLPAVEARADALGLKLAHAPAWFDVDRASDLPRLAGVLDETPHRAPRTRHELAREKVDDGSLVSLIVSTLDEGLLLDACCAALAAQPGPIEIIVADGGSCDGSVERVCDRLDVTVVRSAPGRGRQFAAAAALATGDVLAFVHVDVRLPADATDRMRAALAPDLTEAGAFVTRTLPDPDLPDRAGPLLRLADLRSRITRHPYGDQVLFMTAEAHRATGGFRPLPIMEDYDLSVRLARRAPIARIAEPVLVSGRRIQLNPLRSALLMRLIPPLYRLGVSPDRLARWYRRS